MYIHFVAPKLCAAVFLTKYLSTAR